MSRLDCSKLASVRHIDRTKNSLPNCVGFIVASSSDTSNGSGSNECQNVRFSPEGKTAHFGLAVSNRSRVAIWALSRFGYSRNGG